MVDDLVISHKVAAEHHRKAAQHCEDAAKCFGAGKNEEGAHHASMAKAHNQQASRQHQKIEESMRRSGY